MLVIDAIGRGRAVMFGLITAETSEKYKHVLRALRSLYSGGKNPSTFVVDKCVACMEAIHKIYSTAKIVICKFHVMRAVRRKVRHGLHLRMCAS